MTARQRLTDALEAAGCRPTSAGAARCPAHDDRSPSLSFRDGTDVAGVLVRCHAGCTPEQIVEALGLTLADLFDEPRAKGDRPAGAPVVVAEYPYVDEHGELLYVVERRQPKDFRQKRPDGRGGWLWRLDDVRRVLYRLPEVLAAVQAGRRVLVVEGEKDADRLTAAGHTATCNAGGAGKWRNEYADALKGAEVVVVADRDQPGRAHARQVAASLRGVAATVAVVEAATGKDVTDHLAAGHALDQLVPLADDAPSPESGAAKPDRTGRGPSVADQLLDLALERYTFGCSVDGDLYALPVNGPPVARLLRGGRRSLRAELADAYSDQAGKAPSATALADVMLVLEGRAQRADPRPLYLRVAPLHDGVRLDLGRGDGRAVDVTAAGWRVVEPDDEPLFRRTDLTGELPIPQRGGSLEQLRSLLNVTGRDWPLLVGWLVAVYNPRIPRPALLLTGEQGTGKTTTARTLVELLDPSPAPLRSAPRDEHGWAVSASASWVVGVDNLSTIQPWLSDAMCRAVTGDGVLTRRLYTDADLAVLAFRRALLLTTIDLGALRGDLADRLLTVELERIEPEARRTDGQLRQTFEAAHPRILGALLDLLVRVLGALPEARRTMTDRPRMADFGEVLAALDLVAGTTTVAAYAEVGKRLAADVIEGDCVAAAVRALLPPGRDEWKGSAAELLDALEVDDDHRRPRDWPATPRALAGRVLRAAPALRSVGVVVEQGKSHGVRWYRLHRPDEAGDGRGTVGADRGTVGPPRGTVGEPYRPPSQPRSAGETARRGTVGTVEGPPSPTCLLKEVGGEQDTEAGREDKDEEYRARPSAPSPPSPALAGASTAPPAEVGPCSSCGTSTRRYGPAGSPRCEPCAALHAPRLPSRRRLYADAVREAAS